MPSPSGSRRSASGQGSWTAAGRQRAEHAPPLHGEHAVARWGDSKPPHPAPLCWQAQRAAPQARSPRTRLLRTKTPPRRAALRRMRSALGRGRHRLQLLDHAWLHEHASLRIRDRHIEYLREHDAPQVASRPVRYACSGFMRPAPGAPLRCGSHSTSATKPSSANF